MSVNVLVIPEDFRKDQYMLKPIIEKMMQSLGVKARVVICKDPLLGGVTEALKWERLLPILERYRGMTQIFLLAVDRDGDAHRAARLRALEDRARKILGKEAWFFADHAWQELEVWVLAGMKNLPRAWNWKEIRDDRDPKEHYFRPYAEKRGVIREPYEGRATRASEAARNYKRIRRLCAEDVQAIEKRMGQALRG
jgi:hypothetical protein